VIVKAILLFIDGTICDTRQRHVFIGTPAFYHPDRILSDQPVPGSAAILMELAGRYQIVYMGARPEFTRAATEKWLKRSGFPNGTIFLGESLAERLKLLDELKPRFDFIAGIGDRWDDNLLHTEIGCLSLILQEYEGDWQHVFERIDRYHRKLKIEQNRMHLTGKVEGLARVCPLLLSKYGEKLWDAYHGSVMELAEKTRPQRMEEDLASFAQHALNPADLRDAATWDEINRKEDWENNPVYGLQKVELEEASQNRYVHKVTFCYYADLWKKQGYPEIGYQIHCRTDVAWWDRPAWNPDVRFEQPMTLMQGDDHCLFIQTIPNEQKT
jgi:hypothetical protein